MLDKHEYNPDKLIRRGLNLSRILDCGRDKCLHEYNEKFKRINFVPACPAYRLPAGRQGWEWAVVQNWRWASSSSAVSLVAATWTSPSWCTAMRSLRPNRRTLCVKQDCNQRQNQLVTGVWQHPAPVFLFMPINKIAYYFQAILFFYLPNSIFYFLFFLFPFQSCSGRNQAADNHVFFQASQIIGPTGHRRIDQHARGLLKRRWR